MPYSDKEVYMEEKYISKYETGQAVDNALDHGVSSYNDVQNAKTDESNQTYSSLKARLEADKNNLQNQIDQIVRAPESGGDVAAEVTQARVDSFGNSHDTLKTRLDDEFSRSHSDIEDSLDMIYDGQEASPTKNIFIDLGERIPESFIDANGEEKKSGTGTGNNWCTGFIRVPIGKTIHVISPLARFNVASYDIDKSFVDFKIGTWDGLAYTGDRTFTSSAPFIRLSFYDSDGFTDEKFDNVRILYRVDDSHVIENSNVIDSFNWGLHVPGTSTINFSPTTIGLSDIITLDKTMKLHKIDNTYSYGVVYFDTVDQTSSTHAWFKTDVDDIIIPANVPVWIGLRETGVTNQKLPRFISDILSLTSCENEIVYGISAMNMFNGAHFGNFSATSHRVANATMVRADEDLLLRLKNKNAVYTILTYTGDSVDYTGANWKNTFSTSEPMVIRKGTWYSFSTCYKEGSTEYGTETMAKEMYDNVEIVPVSKLQYDDDATASVYKELEILSQRLNKVEVANSINTIPEHYVTHINQKVAELNAMSSDLMFGFITDTHYNGYSNKKHSKSLINNLCNDVKLITRFFNGGDLINTGADYTKAEIIRNIMKAADYTRPDCPVPQYMILGNHDTGEDYPGGVKVDAKLTAEEFAIASGLYSNFEDMVFDPLNCTQYYIDDKDLAVRYIVLSANLKTLTGETFTDTWRFLAESLLSAGDRTIFVFNHIIRGSDLAIPPFIQTIFDALDAYKARGTFTYSGATYDFSSAQGTIAALIGGHVHKDIAEETTDHIPVIMTTTDNATAEIGDGVSRTENTVNEQAFDIFCVDLEHRRIKTVRIGSGSDRNFSY